MKGNYIRESLICLNFLEDALAKDKEFPCIESKSTLLKSLLAGPIPPLGATQTGLAPFPRDGPHLLKTVNTSPLTFLSFRLRMSQSYSSYCYDMMISSLPVLALSRGYWSIFIDPVESDVI